PRDRERARPPGAAYVARPRRRGNRMKPKQPAEVEKGSMYVRIKHSHPSHVHVTVAKVVREGNSVRHHHVASIGKVKHSGRRPDGTYKFALGAREMLCG